MKLIYINFCSYRLSGPESWASQSQPTSQQSPPARDPTTKTRKNQPTTKTTDFIIKILSTYTVYCSQSASQRQSQTRASKLLNCSFQPPSQSYSQPPRKSLSPANLPARRKKTDRNTKSNLLKQLTQTPDIQPKKQPTQLIYQNKVPNTSHKNLL